MRRRYNIPTSLENFEFLYNELIRIEEQRGIGAEVPETFIRYIPEK